MSNTESERETWNELWLIKTRKVSHMTIRHKLLKACDFRINDSRIHSNIKISHEDSAGWCGWCGLPSTHRKNIRTSSQSLTRRAADVISEACFPAITRDRQDELAAVYLSMIAVGPTPSWLIWIFKQLFKFSYIFNYFCFVILLFFILTRRYIYHSSVSCVWSLLPFVSLQSNWAVKTFKLWL